MKSRPESRLSNNRRRALQRDKLAIDKKVPRRTYKVLCPITEEQGQVIVEPHGNWSHADILLGALFLETRYTPSQPCLAVNPCLTLIRVHRHIF